MAPSYDCFVTGDVAVELILLVQILTTLAEVGSLPDTIKRVYKKCYQLVESHKVTTKMVDNFKRILEAQIALYPELARDSVPTLVPVTTHAQMAHVVLAGEVAALRAALDTSKLLAIEGTPLAAIDDGKLVRNITKKRAATDGGPSKKRK